MTSRRTSGDLRQLFFIPTILVLCLVLLPVIVVIAIAFGNSPTYQFPPHGLTLRWFHTFLTSSTFSQALFRISLPLAFASSICATMIGTLAAIGIARADFRGRRYVELLFVAPVIFPQIILAVGLFLLYARLSITPTIASLCLGHILIGTPYVIRTVGAGLSGIDSRLEQAAQNLGASPARAFLLATLPLLWSSILSGAIFAFIISFSDINIALFLSVADTATLPVQILAQMQYSSDPTIAAASALQVLIVGALVLAAQSTIKNVRL